MSFGQPAAVLQAKLADAVGEAVVDQVVEDATQLAGVCLHWDRIRGQARGNLGIEQLGTWQLGTWQSAFLRILPLSLAAGMVEQRWRPADILRLGIGEGQQLVYTRATRTTQVLPRAQATLLTSCQTFRAIDQLMAGKPDVNKATFVDGASGETESGREHLSRWSSARASRVARPRGCRIDEQDGGAGLMSVTDESAVSLSDRLVWEGFMRGLKAPRRPGGR